MAGTDQEPVLPIPRPFPLQQGNLDFLCSTYAAINAMACRGEITQINQAAIPFRLAMQFMQANKDWDLAGNICMGHDEEDYPDLLAQLSWRDWQVPLYDPDLATVAGALQTAPCVIVSLVRPEDLGRPSGAREVLHYTVLTALTAERIALADSMGAQEILRAGADLLYGFKGRRPVPVGIGCLYAMA